MNHTKKAAKTKRFKCNLKQSDIFTAFENWKAIKKGKDMKRAALFDKVIVIDDSDTEETEAYIKVPKNKRPLAHPFSDTEEDKTDPSSVPTPKTKRNLPRSFFDSEDEAIEKSRNSSGDLMHPMACSTPLSSQQFSTSDTLNSRHIGIEDILNISAIKSEPDDNASDPAGTTVIEKSQNDQTVQMKELASTLLLAADASTVVMPSQNDTTIQIRQHIIIPPPGTDKRPMQVGSGVKRCVEEDRNAKKQKTDSISRSDSSQSRWLSKKDRLFEYQKKNSDGTPKSNKSEKKTKESASNDIQSPVSVVQQAEATVPLEGCKSGKTTESRDLNHNLSTEKHKTPQKNNTESATSEKKTKDSTSDEIQSPISENLAGKQAKATVPLKGCTGNDKSGKKTTESRDLSTEKHKTAPNQSQPKAVPSTSKRNSSVKKETKAMNTQPLKLITDLFKKVFASRHISNIPGEDRMSIQVFLDMNVSYQYVCFKLLTWKRKWYNAHKFCGLIHADLEETEVAEMVGVFERHGMIDTNYSSDSAAQLLPRLDNSDLRGICDKFRLKKTLKNKEDMIQSLLKYSDTQSTLTVNKTTKDLLMDEIQRRMGKCMRVNERFSSTFQSVYLLGTFPNPRFATIAEYIASVLRHNVVFPVVRIDEYTVFASVPDFLRFAKARQYRNALEEVGDPLVCLQLCKTVFDELRAIEDDRSAELFARAPHLVRFTAKAVYASVLSAMTEKLFCKFPEDVRAWLEYMIAHVDCPHKIGHWYFHLVWLYMRYLRPFDYDRAAELLVEVLSDKRRHLSQVQLYQLRKRGEQLICTKKYKILQIHHDRIAELLPRRIRTHEFPETCVDAKTIRSNVLGLKRNYEVRDQQGNKAFLQVEEIALNYYLTELGYTGGEHCEGALVKATFTLFFFDIIYGETKSVPGTFISDLQSEPLDMNTRYFYANRQEEIDKRLREIESGWSDAYLMKFLKDKYDKHSHEFAVCEVGRIIPDPWLLEVIVECVGRQVLAKIFERLVQNFREHRSGLPDLLVWNVDTKQCKFVEVKGENDRLSVGQTLWLDYLRNVGAHIEVCHVHSIGSKKKKEKKVVVDEEPSTSSSIT